MPKKQNRANSKQNEESVTGFTDAAEPKRVPPSERRRQVLEFIAEHDIPLPPLAIFAGMRRQYRATFSYRTTQNILSDLVDAGDVFRVDTSELRNGVISGVDDDGARRTYYFITDAGRDRVENAKPQP
jgi:predicted transcriptional regulator